jgi:hypothetical protein
MSEFQLSRIQAEGWKAGRALSADESAECDLRGVAGRNPYKGELERARWAAGFLSALGNTNTLTFRAVGGG